MIRLELLVLLALAPALGAQPSGAAQATPPPALESGALAGDHRELRAPISQEETERFLRAAARPGLVEVTVEGESGQGRPIFSVRLKRGAAPARWRVLVYAQQHGDEVAGKHALLVMIRDVLREPARLPEDVELWLVPSVNPDGSVAGTRRNARGADLNRDHLLLLQPETQALYRVVRRARPDVSVDCHEFGRDGEAWRKKGWTRLPIVTMDTANHPLLDPAVVRAGLRWVEEARGPLAAAGHVFERYTVGGPPPEAEQRPSAFDADDGRNGVALHGGLSFIIESGVRWAAPEPHADLGTRVDAYLRLLWRFVEHAAARAEDRRVIEAARERRLPAFLPTNVLWGNVGGRVSVVPVLGPGGQVREVPTPNLMLDPVVKRSVATPQAYAVLPPSAAPMAALLERHAVPFETLGSPLRVRAERSRLLRVEEAEDPVHARYAGRQVVERDAAAEVELPAGSLLVRLDAVAPLAAARAAVVLEPTILYGMYQYPEFRALVGPDGVVPVLRVLGGD